MSTLTRVDSEAPVTSAHRRLIVTVHCDGCMRSATFAYLLGEDVSSNSVKANFAAEAQDPKYLKNMSRKHKREDRCSKPDMWMECHVWGEQVPS